MPVTFSDNPVEWQEVPGVYINLEPPPQLPEIESSGSLTKVVGQFPWGPTDEIITIRDPQSFMSIVGRASTPEDYPGFRGLYGKVWGELKVVRVSEASQAKSSIDIHYEGEYTVDSYDGGDDYELTFQNIPNGPHTVSAASADHSNEDDVYTHLEQEINNHPTLSDYIRAVADTGADILYVVPDGDEDWTVSLNTPATGSHSFDSIIEQYTLEADHVGAVGDEIHIEHVQVSSSEFEIIERWGAEAITHGPYPFDGNSDTADEINDDLRWTDFSWAGSFNSNENPRSRTRGVNLKGGSDGSFSPGDNQPFVDGLDVLLGAEEGGQIIVPEVDLNETPNDGLIAKGQSVADQTNSNFLHKSIGSSNTLDSRLDKVDTYSDAQTWLTAARVRQFIEGTEYDVDFAPFVASAMSQIPQHVSPAAARASEYLQPIRGFAGTVPVRADYVKAERVGALLPVQEADGSWRLRSGIATNGDLILRVVMEQLVGRNVGLALLPFQSEPPTDTMVASGKTQIDRTLEILEGDEDIPDSRMIEGFGTQVAQHTSQQVIYEVKVDLWGAARSLVATVTVGTSVQVEF